MRKSKLFLLLMLVLALALAACGGDDGDSSSSDTTSSDSDAARGEELYNQTAIGSAPGCITCHSLEDGVTLVGPSHYGMGTRAETAIDGQSAEEYLRESIVNPDAHITDGYTAGVMWQTYGEDLTDQQIDDLVAFLLTLK